MVCIDITPLSFLTIFFFSHNFNSAIYIFLLTKKKPFHINPPFGGIFVNEENPFQNNTLFGGIFVDEKKLSHLCCHNVLYILNNPSVIFLTQLHSISEYCRILNTPHHICLYWNWLNTLPSSSSRAGGELGGASQLD